MADKSIVGAVIEILMEKRQEQRPTPSQYPCLLFNGLQIVLKVFKYLRADHRIEYLLPERKTRGISGDEMPAMQSFQVHESSRGNVKIYNGICAFGQGRYPAPDLEDTPVMETRQFRLDGHLSDPVIIKVIFQGKVCLISEEVFKTFGFHACSPEEQRGMNVPVSSVPCERTGLWPDTPDRIGRCGKN